MVVYSDTESVRTRGSRSLKLLDPPKTTRWYSLTGPTPQTTRFTWKCSNVKDSGWSELAHPSRTALVGPAGQVTRSTWSAGSVTRARPGLLDSLWDAQIVRPRHTDWCVSTHSGLHMDLSLAAGLISCACPSCNAFWRPVGNWLRQVRVGCRGFLLFRGSCVPLSYYFFDTLDVEMSV